MKKLFALIIIVCVFLVCCGCYEENPYYPEKYPMTKWQSDDESITFFVDDMRNCIGTIKTEEQEFDFFLDYNYPYGDYLCVLPLEYYNYPYVHETDVWNIVGGNRGVLIIENSSNVFFEIGEIIEIKIVEKNISRDDIPPIPEKPENYEELLQNSEWVNESGYEEFIQNSDLAN